MAAASMFALPACAVAAEPAARTAITPAWNWNGFYAGLNAGWGWSGRTASLTANSASMIPQVTAGVVPLAIDFDPDGFLGGGQLGYNWQNGALVLASRPIFRPAESAAGAQSFFLPQAVSRRRGPPRPENSTGSAPCGASVCTILFGGACDGFRVGSLKETKIGWTIGAGAEHAWQGNWSLKIEYLYIDLGSSTVRLTDPTLPGDFLDYRFKHGDHIVRLGINYKY